MADSVGAAVESLGKERVEYDREWIRERCKESWEWMGEELKVKS